MLKIIVKREGVSNVPAFIFDADTAASQIVEAIEEIILAPNAYHFEFVGEFVWNELDSEKYRHFIEPLLRISMIDNGTIPLLFGFLQAAALIHD